MGVQLYTFEDLPVLRPLKYFSLNTDVGLKTYKDATEKCIMARPLKEYSVILRTSFYDMNQKILRKHVISKISVDSDFPFASYA